MREQTPHSDSQRLTTKKSSDISVSQLNRFKAYSLSVRTDISLISLDQSDRRLPSTFVVQTGIEYTSMRVSGGQIESNQDNYSSNG